MYCAYCGTKLEENCAFCPGCGKSAVQNPALPSMKWYKFLIHFSLCFSAVMNIVSGMQYLTATAYLGYDMMPSAVRAHYAVYPGAQILDIVYGIVLLGLAVLAFVARVRLICFAKNGPALVYALYAGALLSSAIYSCLSFTVVGQSFAGALPSMIGAAIGQGAVLVCNYIYFNKRKDLFVNGSPTEEKPLLSA